MPPRRHRGHALEQANSRSEHEWQVWGNATQPEARKLIPAVSSHATNVVEPPNSSPSAWSG